MHTILGLALLLAFQAAPNKPEEKKASIEGTVVDAAQGKPVKDATLLLIRTSGAGTPATTKSDEAGKFKFKDLDAGTYMLMSDHAKYARQTYGSRNGLLGGAPIVVATGQELNDLTFKLQANAVASGRVLDDDGDPVQGALVTAVKGIYQRGKRQFIPVGKGMTNDLGEYRIANLASGRYLVSAMMLNPAKAVIKSADGTEQTYLSTYYPNVADSATASPVDVAAGRDVSGLDVRMLKAPSVRVKGQVTGLGKDQKVVVRLVPKNGGMLAMILGRPAEIKMPEGTFEATGVTAGSYTVRVSDPTGMKALGMGVPLEVGKRPVDGVVVDVTPPSELSGTVVVKGEEKPALKGTRVFLEPTEGLSLMPPNTVLGEDGTFTLKDVMPDKYLVRLASTPANTYVESVKLGNVEMDDNGLALGGGYTGKIEVRLSTGGAQVDGIVNGPDDNPMSGVTVALVPESKQYTMYQSTQTDQKGGFSFKGVKPGEYRAMAWEQIEPNAFQDPEFVKPYERKAERVSLKESDRKALTLKVLKAE